MKNLQNPQALSSNNVPFLHHYLYLQRKKNLGHKNTNVKKHTDCKFSRDPIVQQTMRILMGSCDQDNLSDRFLCLQNEFREHYDGRGGRTVNRQQVGILMQKAAAEGLLRIVPERSRSGRLNWLNFTEKTVEIIEKSKVFVVDNVASNPFIVPCTVQPTEYNLAPNTFGFLDLGSPPQPYPDQEIFDLLNDVWSPPEKEKNIKPITRLPKASTAEGSPVKPRKSSYKSKFSSTPTMKDEKMNPVSSYKSKFICSKETLIMASEIMIDGGHSTYFKGGFGQKVKQDLNRRLGIRLEQWGFLKDPDPAIKLGLGLMVSIHQAGLSSDKSVAVSMDEYFNRYGIKATKKSKEIIYGAPKVEPIPEPVAEASESEVVEDSPPIVAEPPKGYSLSESFTEDQIKILRKNGLKGDSINESQFTYFKEHFQTC